LILFNILLYLAIIKLKLSPDRSVYFGTLSTLQELGFGVVMLARDAPNLSHRIVYTNK